MTTWTDLDDLRAWVHDAAARAGLRAPTAWTQPHDRPWSTALRFECGDEVLWAKANGPGTAYEPRLLGVLAEVVPDIVPDVLAVDPERRWTLMRDAGPVLRLTGEPDSLWDEWAVVLREYAEAQLKLAPHVDRLLACGVDDLRPAALPARFDALVEGLAVLPPDEGGLTAADADRLRARSAEYAAWCEELDASGVPLSVNHDDLHSANVCVRDGRHRVIDWGDTGVSHPFATMLATLNSVAWHAGIEDDDPRVGALRDAYLDVFDDHGTLEDRRRWVELARRTGCVPKALSYARALVDAPPEAHAEYDWPVRAWLLEALG